MSKKFINFLIITILILSAFFVAEMCNTKCWAAISDVTENPEWWEPDAPNEGDETFLKGKAGIIIGIVQVIGVITSMATLAIIGLRTLFGSAQQKAEYKQMLMPWLLGAAMVFAITTIPNIIYKSITDEAGTHVPPVDIGTVNGYTDGIEYMNTIYHPNKKAQLGEISEQLAQIREEIRNAITGPERKALQKRLEELQEEYDKLEREFIQRYATEKKEQILSENRKTTQYKTSYIRAMEEAKETQEFCRGYIDADKWLKEKTRTIEEIKTQYASKSIIQAYNNGYRKRLEFEL